MSRTIATLLASAAVLAIACSSETNATPSGGGGDDGAGGGDVAACTVKERTGKSTCQADSPPGAPPKDPITCSAGTFCYANNTSAYCQPGCQSDENCGPSERCVRCGDESTGKCRTCNVSDKEACTATNTPAPAPDAAAPSETCTRDTFFDKDCASPGKAFSCPNDLEPTGQGTCVQTDLPGTWCCGGGLASACTRDTTQDMPLCQGKKAYACPPDEEPTGTGCEQSPVGTVWCCPK